MRKTLLLFALLALTISCRKKNPPTCPNGNEGGQAELIFGTAYGECGGNCVHYYLIKDGQLYTDSMDNYGQKLGFLVTPLPAAKYNMALPLLNTFPAALKNNPDSIIGCPDCRDQGLYHFELKENGLAKRWTVDPDSIPAQIKSYMIMVDSVMAGLK